MILLRMQQNVSTGVKNIAVILIMRIIYIDNVMASIDIA